MAGITPVSHVTAPVASSAAGGTRVSKAPGEKGGFAEMLNNYVGKVDQQQRNAGLAVQDLVSGKSEDVLPVVSAVAKADLSFRLLIGVRNKVIEAYKQTMNMQI